MFTRTKISALAFIVLLFPGKTFAVFEYTPRTVYGAYTLNTTAVSSRGVTALFSNPAGLAVLPRLNIEAGYSQLYSIPDLGNNIIGITLPFDANSCAGIGYSSLYQHIGYTESMCMFSYARAVSPGLMFGTTLRIMSVTGNNLLVSSFLADFGLQNRLTQNLSVGIHILNPFGVRIGTFYELIPQELRTGAMWQVSDTVAVLTELSKVQNRDPVFSAAVEYVVIASINLYAGIRTNPAQASLGARFSWSSTYYFDYAYIYHETMTGYHTIGVGIKFTPVSLLIQESVVEKKKKHKVKLKPEKPDLNTITVEELSEIEGIGKITAERIVEYRIASGGYKNIEGLKNIPRLLPVTYDVLKKSLTIKPVPETEPLESDSLVPGVIEEEKLVIEKVNINTAMVDELEAIGLDNQQAQNVVRYRKRNGKYEDIYNLIKVPGIDKNVFDLIKGKIRVE
ncbi:MAG: helix-hairpin-helix domain-containing protein [Elusimicrobiota bacterium]